MEGISDSMLVFRHQKTKGNESFSHAVNFFTYHIQFKRAYMNNTPFVYDVACLASGAFG